MIFFMDNLIGGKLTLDHGEAVEAEDVAVLDPPAGQGVVRPVRVQPGLEPDPGVLQLRPLTRLLARYRTL